MKTEEQINILARAQRAIANEFEAENALVKLGSHSVFSAYAGTQKITLNFSLEFPKGSTDADSES